MRPFQFMADARGAEDGPALRDLARRAEATGYHALAMPDHLISQLGPISALAWLAAATERIRISAFVLNNDLRHPAVLAQELASLDVLSGGRLDVAIGAGWNKLEYDHIGLSFDPTPVRQSRLEEAVAILKGAFGDEPFSLTGRHYTITDYDAQPKPLQRPHPPFFIGGGGRRTLELAAREADIVGLAPRVLPGKGGDPRSITLPATAEKIEWVRDAAGDRFDGLTFNVYPSGAPVVVTDDAHGELRTAADAMRERTGISVSEADLAESPHIFIGSIDSLVEKVEMLRERLGISSFFVGEVGPLDPLVERLAGR